MGNVTIQNKINSQISTGKIPTALFTDIDNTLLHIETLANVSKIQSWLEKYSWPVIYVTGLDFNSVLQRIDDQVIFQPDAIASELGSRLHVRTSTREFSLAENYMESIKNSRFSMRTFLEIFESIPTEIKEKYQLTLQDIEAEYQRSASSVFKVSFFAVSKEQPQSLKAILKNFFPDLKIVISRHVPGDPRELADDKWCIDMVTVTKKTAVNFLRDMYHIDRIVVAGDSGNDADMLFEQQLHFGIIVGGAEKEIVDRAHRMGSVVESKTLVANDAPYYIADHESIAAKGLMNGLLNYEKRYL